MRVHMLTLGLDPSLSAYGFCVFDDSANGRKRIIISGHEKTLSSHVPVARYIHVRALVTNLLNTHAIELVGIESPAYGAGPFQTIHFALMMFCLEPIFNKRIDCVLFDPSTLKSLVRKEPDKKIGVIGKLDMQRFVQLDTMDTNLIDNNEADAYCVAYFATRFNKLKQNMLLPSHLSSSEKRVFLERQKTKKSIAGKRVIRTAHIFRENSRFFEFSRVPTGSIDLPKKSDINQTLLDYISDSENQNTD